MMGSMGALDKVVPPQVPDPLAGAQWSSTRARAGLQQRRGVSCMKCHRIRPGFGSGREPGEDSTASSLKLSTQLMKFREAAVLSVCDEFHEDGVNIVPSL